jgi:hypothetical protein
METVHTGAQVATRQLATDCGPASNAGTAYTRSEDSGSAYECRSLPCHQGFLTGSQQTRFAAYEMKIFCVRRRLDFTISHQQYAARRFRGNGNRLWLSLDAPKREFGRWVSDSATRRKILQQEQSTLV